MGYYNYQSVPSGFINPPNNNEPTGFDVANQGLGIFENLLKYSKARREEQEDSGFRLFSSVISNYGQKVKDLESELGPKDPLVVQKRMALDQLTSKLYQDQQDVVAGRKRKLDVIRDPENNRLISSLVAPIDEQSQARYAEAKDTKRKEKQLKQGFGVLSEATPEKKNELKRILQGQPTQTEQARAQASQMMSQGAGPSAFGIQDILGPQQARTQDFNQAITSPEILSAKPKTNIRFDTPEAAKQAAIRSGYKEDEFRVKELGDGSYNYIQKSSKGASSPKIKAATSGLIKMGYDPEKIPEDKRFDFYQDLKKEKESEKKVTKEEGSILNKARANAEASLREDGVSRNDPDYDARFRIQLQKEMKRERTLRKTLNK